MSNKQVKFNVTEAAVKLLHGDDYHIDKFIEGTDYVRRKCFKSHKNVFREDIHNKKIDEPSTCVDDVVTCEDQVATCVDKPVYVMAKVTRKYPNTKIIDTSVGRINVGKYGVNLRVGQVIKLRDNKLVTGW
jgi:hypothetical protein